MPPPGSQAILRLQATAGNHATAALLQRVIKPAFAKPPDWYAPLHKLVEDYNKLRASPVLWGLVPSWLATGKPQARQLALTALGDVERWVYAWFGQRGDRDITADPEWAAMRELLNQVQEERIGLVAICARRRRRSAARQLRAAGTGGQAAGPPDLGRPRQPEGRG